MAGQNLRAIAFSQIAHGASLGTLCRLCYDCYHVRNLSEDPIHLLPVLMPRTLQVSQPDESRLASAENALSDIARQSEPLPGPEIDKAALHKRTRRSAWS